jgi:hypothetical protein
MPVSESRRGQLLAGAAIVAVVLAAAGYFAGHASAGGPSSLAAAVTQAQQGKLPCGDTSSVQLGGPGGAQAGGRGFGGGGFFLQRLCGGAGGGAAGQGGPGAGGGRFGGGGGAGGLFAPGAVAGRITAVHGSKLTLQTRAGALTVSVGPRTAITKTGAGSRRDLKAGETASVASTAAASGARSATRIFVLPTAGG